MCANFKYNFDHGEGYYLKEQQEVRDSEQADLARYLKGQQQERDSEQADLAGYLEGRQEERERGRRRR